VSIGDDGDDADAFNVPCQSVMVMLVVMPAFHTPLAHVVALMAETSVTTPGVSFQLDFGRSRSAGR
jgi:hypothetical protein